MSRTNAIDSGAGTRACQITTGSGGTAHPRYPWKNGARKTQLVSNARMSLDGLWKRCSAIILIGGASGTRTVSTARPRITTAEDRVVTGEPIRPRRRLHSGSPHRLQAATRPRPVGGGRRRHRGRGHRGRGHRGRGHRGWRSHGGTGNRSGSIERYRMRAAVRGMTGGIPANRRMGSPLLIDHRRSGKRPSGSRAHIRGCSDLVEADVGVQPGRIDPGPVAIKPGVGTLLAFRCAIIGRPVFFGRHGGNGSRCSVGQVLKRLYKSGFEVLGV